MRRLFASAACFAILMFPQWSAAQTIAPDKTGAALKEYLRTHFRPSSPQTYRGAREKMFSSIDNHSGKVRCVYTGVEITTSTIPNDRVMNTEHTWPQSKFNERLPMKADLHHLFPTLSKPNNDRSNNPFAEIPDDKTVRWWRSNAPLGSPSPSADIKEFSESDGRQFEPREDQKGNTARAMFYVWTVYAKDNIEPGFIQSQLTTLKHWHHDDPADHAEVERSSKIRAVQGNDNPFVLDATLVDRILGSPTPVLAPALAGRAAATAPPETALRSIRVVGWNMQSDFAPNQKESNPDFLKQLIAAKSGVNIWGLCEVLDANALKKFEAGAEDGEGSDFISVMGTTGGRDHLAVIYDSQLFEQVGGPIELKTETQLSAGLRASLAVHLKGKQAGQEFIVLVNHLKRGEEQNPIRLKQSQNLNAWARTQQLPIIALGDWNYDWDVAQGDNGVPHRDGGFDALTQDRVFQWVRPGKIVKSQADDHFNSLLDFVFVANAPFGWTGVSRILEREGDTPATVNDFDDNNQNTDHRPVDAVFTLGSPVIPDSREEILKRIQALEQELATLRSRLEDLD